MSTYAVEGRKANGEFAFVEKLAVPMSIHTAFAKAVAAALEGAVVVAEKVHYFDKHDRLWKTGNLSKADGIVTEAVHALYGTRRSIVRQGKREFEHTYLPFRLMNHNWLTPVKMEVPNSQNC